MLGERRHTQNATYYMIAFIRHTRKGKTIRLKTDQALARELECRDELTTTGYRRPFGLMMLYMYLIYLNVGGDYMTVYIGQNPLENIRKRILVYVKKILNKRHKIEGQLSFYGQSILLMMREASVYLWDMGPS